MSEQDRIDQELLKKTIGAAARAARKRLGITQEDVAARMDCSAEFYARIERGHAFPSVATLNKIVDVLQVRADELLGLTGEGEGEISKAQAIRNRNLYDDLSPELRRLLGRLRIAEPGTLRLITSIAKELERTAGDAEGDDEGDGAAEDSATGDSGEIPDPVGDAADDDAADDDDPGVPAAASPATGAGRDDE